MVILRSCIGNWYWCMESTKIELSFVSCKYFCWWRPKMKNWKGRNIRNKESFRKFYVRFQLHLLNLNIYARYLRKIFVLNCFINAILELIKSNLWQRNKRLRFISRRSYLMWSYHLAHLNLLFRYLTCQTRIFDKSSQIANVNWRMFDFFLLINGRHQITRLPIDRKNWFISQCPLHLCCIGLNNIIQKKNREGKITKTESLFLFIITYYWITPHRHRLGIF
jgi:hypothetical protein